MDEQICCGCGRSVKMGSGRFVNRVPIADNYERRVELGFPYPEGAFLCAECDSINDYIGMVKKTCRGFFKKDSSGKLIILERLIKAFNEYSGLNVRFMFENDDFMYYITGGGCYLQVYNTIKLFNKPSMMTFLHEWKHAMGERDELLARRWSHGIFRAAFPKTYKHSLEQGLFKGEI